MNYCTSFFCDECFDCGQPLTLNVEYNPTKLNVSCHDCMKNHTCLDCFNVDTCTHADYPQMEIET